MRIHFACGSYGYRYGSGGAGEFCGGDGLTREIELLADAQMTLLAERRKFRPWGLQGGEDGAAGAALIEKTGAAEKIELPGKCSLT